MSNDKIKSLVVPRLFEKVGKKVVNKRNKLGKVFNFAKNKPESAKAMKEIEEAFSKLHAKEKFSIEQFVTIVENNYIYRTLESSIEQAIESNDSVIIAESMKSVGFTIIKHLK